MEFLVLIGIALIVWRRFRARRKQRVAYKFDSYNQQINSSSQQRKQFWFGGEKRAGWDPYLDFDDIPDYRPGKKKRQLARWIGRGETVEIAGLTIKGGLIYFGESLPTQNGYQNENCLINPNWKVDRSARYDPYDNGLSYWPAYHSITAAQRMTYLRWLAGDRADPDIDIGYVFLYFYGLERRLFLDEAASDIDTLIGEIERLLAIYGKNRSFRSYAGIFLAAAIFLKGELLPAPSLSPETAGFELPPILRATIGLKLRDGERLSWDWLLAWFLADPETYLRTPAKRCFEEFKLLFERRFRERYPDGLAVRAPKKTLLPQYRAASGTFTVTLDNRHGSIPDPANLKVPIKIAGEITEQATSGLDAYSRHLGRNPGSERTLAAQLLLPPELPHAAGSVIGQFRAFLDERMVGATALMPLSELLLQLQIDDGREKPAANTLKILSKALAACDVGMEPDRVFGAQKISRETDVVLFRAKEGGTVDVDRQAFAAGRILVELAAMAITADGVADDSETAVVIEDLKCQEDLFALERVRLLALLSALIHSPSQQQSVLRRLAKADEAIRDNAAQIVLTIIAADGRLDTQEIQFAEKLYKALKLPHGRLYADLNGLGAAPRRDEPAVIIRSERGKTHPIPNQPSEPRRTGGIVLDPALVAAKKRETAKVYTLLAMVFAEEESIDVTVPQTAAGDKWESRYEGLDAAHSNLIEALITNKEMAQVEFAALCRKAGLFAAGAIETINDWAFETLDDPLIEDGDPIAIDPALVEPLVEITTAPSKAAQ